jgi:hypothetical protein
MARFEFQTPAAVDQLLLRHFGTAQTARQWLRSVIVEAIQGLDDNELHAEQAAAMTARRKATREALEGIS